MLILLMLLLMSLMMNFVMMGSVYWFPSWIMMELTSFIFVMMISNSQGSSIMKKVILWKYFLYQCIGSILLLMAMFIKINQIQYFYEYFVSMIMLFGLIMKLGLPPFHKWSFEVSENMSWLMFLLMNSIQKVPPLVMVWNLTDMNWLMIWISSFLMLFSLMSLFDWSLRRFMLYSSIMNYVWILLCSVMDSMSMVIYMLIYFLTLTGLVLLMSKYSFPCFSFMNSNNLIFMTGPLMNLLMSVNIMSMSGLPPLAGFVTKYDAIMSILINSLKLISIMLIFSSMLLLIMYLFLLIGSMMLNKGFCGWMTKKDYWSIIICCMNMTMPFLYFM